MDFVVRVNYSTKLEKKIESKAEGKQELGEIRDQFYKPEGEELSDFSPRDIIVRKRTFPEKETLVKINIIQKPLGYTDTKREVESLETYEKWGEFTSSAVEYRMKIRGNDVSVLIETFSFGKYVKLESSSMEVLNEVIKEFGLDESQIIEKNSAELLAEERNII